MKMISKEAFLTVAVLSGAAITIWQVGWYVYNAHRVQAFLNISVDGYRILLLALISLTVAALFLVSACLVYMQRRRQIGYPKRDEAGAKWRMQKQEVHQRVG
jgi:predicted neutral ceramidase superfamily lipid hydrolase